MDLLNVVTSSAAMPLRALRSLSTRIMSTLPVSQLAQVASDATVIFIDVLINLIALVTKSPAKDSKHLIGDFKPQPLETTDLDATITGKIPDEIRGMFVNVCPNPQYLPVGGYHIFEGDGAVTTVRVHEGRASFAFRHLKTQKSSEERRLRHSPILSVTAMKGVSGLMMLMLTMLRKACTLKKYSRSTANTNIIVHGGRVYVLWEGGLPYELSVTPDGTSMQCSRLVTFPGYSGSFSAHPVKHPSNGRLYSVSYSPMKGTPDVTVVVLDSDGGLVRTVSVTLGRKALIHDAAVTERYVIILDFPLLIKPEDILGPNAVVRLHRDKPGRIGLMPIDATHEGEIKWFEVPPRAVFHSVCAWDTDDGNVVMYLCSLEDFEMDDSFSIQDGDVVRYEINVTKGKVVTAVEPINVAKHIGVSKAFVDFPFVDRSKYGRKVEYAFGTILMDTGDGFPQNVGIAKYNLEKRELEGAIRYESGGKPAMGVSEVGFVPRPSLGSEDGGYLTTFVRDADGNVTMDVYDAVNMSNEPIARVHAPKGFHVPFGFHSEFIPESTLTRI